MNDPISSTDSRAERNGPSDLAHWAPDSITSPHRQSVHVLLNQGMIIPYVSFLFSLCAAGLFFASLIITFYLYLWHMPHSATGMKWLALAALSILLMIPLLKLMSWIVLRIPGFLRYSLRLPLDVAASINTLVIERIVAVLGARHYHSLFEAAARLLVSAGTLGLCWLLCDWWPRDFRFAITHPSLAGFFDLQVSVVVCGWILVLGIQTTYQLMSSWLVVRDRLSRHRPILQYDPHVGTDTLMTLGHISDLHTCESDEASTIEGCQSPNPQLRAMFGSLQRSTDIDVVLATGDLTDSGTREEWRVLLESIPLEVRDRLLILPGNHDINIPDKRSLWSSDTGRGRPTRLVRFMAALDKLQGARTMVLDGEKTVLLSQRFSSVRGQLLEALQNKYGNYAWIGAVWASLFPMVYVHEQSKTCIYLLNSIDVGTTMADNAFGVLGDHQIERLRAMRKSFASYAAIIALHHHIALPKEIGFERGRERFLVLRNAPRLLAFLEEGDNCVVFHGHRHVQYHGRLGQVEINAAPSSTLHSQTAKPAGVHSSFLVHTIGKHPGGGIATSASTIRPVGR